MLTPVMTPDKLAKRVEFADAMQKAADLAKDVPYTGWDIPPWHIKEELERWAKYYRRKGDVV